MLNLRRTRPPDISCRNAPTLHRPADRGVGCVASLGVRHPLISDSRESRFNRLLSHSQAGFSGRTMPDVRESRLVETKLVPSQPSGTKEWHFLMLGAIIALAVHMAVQWISHLPVWQRLVGRFIWWQGGVLTENASSGTRSPETTALTLYNDNAESVEWFNMCWRKMWRVYQRGLERWLADLLQPVFDNLVAEVAVPRFVQRLRILEFTLDHEAPAFSQMRRRSSRKDSDLNGVVNVRYTGGARMLLLIEVGQGRWRFKLPVLVSDLDLECKLWIKLRLAPMTPYVGTISLAFVGPPNIKVQLLPYNHVRLMRIPILQPFLSKLLTVGLPNLMVLPKRLEINIPPAVTAVAEAAVGHDAVMRAVASAVLQADALEHALMAALPLGPQSAAGGISLPDSFHGELQVILLEAKDLPVWGFPWQSNPYCRVILGSQAVRSRKDDDTSHAGRHRAPVWNQEFQFLVEDPMSQVLEIHVRDSHLTGRADLGYVKLPLHRIPASGHMSSWLAIQPWTRGLKVEGELHVKLTYKPFEDDETDTGYREAEAFALMLQEQAITDIKSAADASSRAAVAASAAAAAVAVTKAAAARAAAKAALNAKARARQRKMEAEAEKQKGIRRLDRKLSKERLATLAAGAASVEKRRNAEPVSESEGGERQDAAKPAALDSLALQDISPEDLFPPVSFTISDRADEDMPYTRPAPAPAEEGERNDTQMKSRDEPARSSNGAGRLAGAAATASKDGQSGNSDAARLEISTESVSDLDLPLVLSTLENASIQEALSLDSNISDVVKAVANGDIKAFREDGAPPRPAPEIPASNGSTVNRGPLKDTEEAPLQVSAGAQVTAKETSTAESEIQARATQGGASSVALSQASEAAAKPAGVQKPGLVKQLLSKVPFLGGPQTSEDVPEPGPGASGEEGEREDERDNGGIIANVVVTDNVHLEAIAEEVQNSWKLREDKTDDLLQRAVARSERSWLILLSSLFISTIALLFLNLVVLLHFKA